MAGEVVTVKLGSAEIQIKFDMHLLGCVEEECGCTAGDLVDAILKASRSGKRLPYGRFYRMVVGCVKSSDASVTAQGLRDLLPASEDFAAAAEPFLNGFMKLAAPLYGYKLKAAEGDEKKGPGTGQPESGPGSSSGSESPPANSTGSPAKT